ncbi:MAG: hypothetical protein WC819_03705 [Parcubacteria group bacterium]|jgi:uncharacterized membrane-anchored protein YhcB (DUF1043 family)
MFDKIEKKIHDIQNEPEHIRLRYLWGAVLISMMLIVFIWVMSLKTTFLQVRNDKDMQKSLETLQEQLDTIKAPTDQQSVSIDDLLQKPASQQPEM